jgi:hypothetical protein
MARDWNQQIIEEFRANGGRVGGRFEGLPLLLLHHRGARSGKQHVNPLAYGPWRAALWRCSPPRGARPGIRTGTTTCGRTPRVEVEVAGSRIRARARVAEGEERERIWRAQTSEVPAFGTYQERTGRTIPVVIIEPEE